MIDIKSITGEVLFSVPILKDAVRCEELMASDYVQLSWESDTGYSLPVGSYIEYEGERYFLLSPYQPTMQNEMAYRYNPQFHSRISRWQKVIVPVYTYQDDGVTVKSKELDWTFTGTPEDFMFMIQKALLHETGESWSYVLSDNLPSTITVTAQSSSIWSLLTDVAEKCKTEWWAYKASNTLFLSKCLHGVTVDLEVGRNVKVTNISSNRDEYFTRFYAFGSTRNVTQMDGVVQGSIVNKRLTLDPTKYPDGYKDIRGHFENGVYVSDLKPEEVLETSLYFEDIYPSSSLTISNVRNRMKYRLDEDGNKIKVGGTDEAPVYDMYPIWYFQLPELVFSEDMIIEGKTLSVSFKSGRLRGREFELAFHSEAKKVADAADVDSNFAVQKGDFEIIFDESSGMLIPDETYIIPADSDEIVLFNIVMPDEYVASSRQELETELDKEIAEYKKDNNSYSLESNPVAFYEEDTNVVIGQSVNFIYNGSTLSTRVLKVEKHLDVPCEQKLTIGNVKIVGSRQQLRTEVRNIGAEVSKIRETDELQNIKQRDFSRDLMITANRYFAMRETLEMLQGAIEGFTDGISPVTVQTMALLVGDQALQFKFTKSKSSLESVDCPVSYDVATKTLTCSSSTMAHMTLGIDAISSTRSTNASDYFTRKISGYIVTLTDPSAYYVYVKANRVMDTASFRVSKTPIGMEDEASYYNFLVGVLTSENNNSREFVPLYGFTEILPSQVTTNIIRSANGKLVIDLENAIITAADGATIEGSLTIGSGSKGLSNLSEWGEAQTQITNAATKAENANTAATTANENATKANSTAQSAASTATSALSLAGTANTNATNASTAAGEAKTTAQTAKESADSASTTATNADKKAEEAKSASTTALVNAQAAFETAGTASETATTALGKAQEAEEAASAATSVANEAKAAITLINTSVTNLDTKIGNIASGVEESIKEINDKLDGVVESFFEPYTPSRTNLPASEWIANGTEEDHIGDTFTNTSTAGDDAGKSWRWLKQSDGSYDWQQIADSDAAKALLLAAQAQTAADGKSKTFVSQPVPPYKEGDLWVQGGNGDIMRCKDGVDRTSGSFVADDWEKASKYTDDTKANEAQETANATKATLDELTADGVITPFEYEFFFTELANVNYDRHRIQLDVERYGLDDSAEYASYAQFAEFYYADLFEINGGNPPMPVPSGLIWHRNGYYGHLGTIRDLIAATAKAEVENAQSTANGANALAQAAQNAANAASNAVGVLNDDGYITLIEKRSLRTIAKKISSYEGTSLPYVGTDTYTGEIHDWISVAEQKKDNAVTALVQEAYNAASAVILWLYGPMGISSDATTDVSAIGGVREMLETRLIAYYTAINVLVNSVPVSDYEYLKAALGNAASLDVEGVVLSQMMGVKDKNNKVRALLNGSDVGKDTEHGKMMLAAGIPTDGTIANKIHEATTRIYEDGCVYSKNMHLEEGCTIGNAIKIQDEGIKIDTPDDGVVSIDETFGFVTENKSMAAHFGGIACNNSMLEIYTKDAQYKIACPAEPTPITVASTTDAIRCYSGMVSGLRPKTRVIAANAPASDSTLSNFDFSVLVPATSGEYYLKLPDVPLDGQEYWLETFGADVHVSSAKRMWSHSAGKYETSHEFASRGTIRFKYYAEAEIWTYTWVESI